MKDLRKAEKGFVRNKIIIPILVLTLMLFILVAGMQWFGSINDEQNRVLTEQSIKKAAIQCYANEGMFPAELEYLEENYFVVIDREKYNVVYDCYAANIMPNITVYMK